MTKQIVGVTNLDPPPEGTSVTIGTFDGVHLGHRALIARAIATAKQTGTVSAIVTWDRHPNETVHPDRVPPLLSTPERRVELLDERGADMLVVLAFDKELASWAPERFVKEVLTNGLGARSVFVGQGWRFGKGAAGSVEMLEELGGDLGFEVNGIDLEQLGDEPVSSSRVREAVTVGDMEMAERMLGRYFDVDGEVVRGDDRGAALGFPTANVALDPLLVNPAIGVYAGRARANDAWYVAAINVGVNPTFGGYGPPRIEAYLLDFSGDLYGQNIRVEFHKRLRDEKKFDSAEQLIAQMRKDVEQTKALVDKD